MLAALAVNWAFLLLRSVIAMMFGLVALVWPGLTSMGLVMLFGAYTLTDGALALIVALSVSGAPALPACGLVWTRDTPLIMRVASSRPARIGCRRPVRASVSRRR